MTVRLLSDRAATKVRVAPPTTYGHSSPSKYRGGPGSGHQTQPRGLASSFQLAAQRRRGHQPSGPRLLSNQIEHKT